MSKKLIALAFVMLFIFSACHKEKGAEPATENTTQAVTQPQVGDGSLDFRGVWISYIEITEKCESEEAFTGYMKDMFDNFSCLGITDVFFHVRPFADAVYPSEIFPSSVAVCENQGDELKCDYLEIALNTAKEYDMNLHAWINPYRASKDGNINSLSEENQARIWYEEGAGNTVSLIDGRFYFNPACEKPRELIVEGVKELMENYPELAGIHIDDYFYPENCGDFDAGEYEQYVLGGGELSLAQWRQDNVSSLVRELYGTVKSYGENKLFTVSPTGKLDTCKNKLYADVELWCEGEGYCDIILPQIYFGFDNESEPFAECLDSWVELCRNSPVKLVPALALYKCGKEDIYAGERGKNEWTKNNDVISRQVEYIREHKLSGFGLYSGSYVNFSENIYEKELDNLTSVL